ncbi:polysaccharide deacetylase family protein [Naasia sp. SYSU D00948]|uniref:polysaccharide deacetylase family protein n=1 Tax=Naasia sp. SYSU D00948 TaxID=2817379 RepID=UPI001B3179B8|nr:polysaccharide deacetylase family protein [Naasia sp. SYSU D00948]
MTRFRRIVAASAVLLASAPLAGCGGIQTTEGWLPRPAAVAEVALSDTDTAPVPPGEAPGLETRLIYRADPAAGVGARWAEIPGNPAFNTELRALVKAAIDAQAAATGVPFVPAADGPADDSRSSQCAPGATTRPVAELLADPAVTPQTGGPTVTVVCEIVVASGPVLAEALRIVTASGGQVQSDSTTVHYTDTAGGFTARSDGFISDDGARTLLARVVQSLKVAAGAFEPRMQEDPADFPLEQLRAWFSNYTFGPDGSLVVRLPADFTTPELDRLAEVPKPSPLIVTVAADQATPLLSPEGAQVQAALASGEPLTLPSAPPPGRRDVDCSLFACVALTFDDGPSPLTAGLIDLFNSRDSATTFFVQGSYVGAFRDVVRRMHDEGHQIGNHTWNHPDLTRLSAGAVREQIARTNAVIEDITGSAPTIFRPPYGSYNDTVLGATGMPAIMWSRDTLDWQKPGDGALVQRAMSNAQPGDIILMHDIHETTTRVVPQIVDGLLNRGFMLVTVEQILGGTPAPGTVTKR